MLVRFENDAIDETPEMSRILSSANPAGTLFSDLPSNQAACHSPPLPDRCAVHDALIGASCQMRGKIGKEVHTCLSAPSRARGLHVLFWDEPFVSTFRKMC